MEVLECVLHQTWIALLLKIVSSEGNMKVFFRFWFHIVVGPDIRPVLTSESHHSEFYWLASCCLWFVELRVNPTRTNASLLLSQPLLT